MQSNKINTTGTGAGGGKAGGVVTARPKRRKLLDKAIVVKEVQDVILQYDMPVTLRQLHYRLVELSKTKPEVGYKNEERYYKRLSAILVEARRKGLISWDSMEDRTRNVVAADRPFYYYPLIDDEWDPELDIELSLDAMAEKHDNYYLDSNLYQQDVALILLEKQALENVFEHVIGEQAYFVVCKGFNSASQLYQLSKALQEETRRIHVYAFVDYDGSGKHIYLSFVKRMERDFGIRFASVERVALTKELVEELGLPKAPPKKTDSRSLTWEDDGVVELDAVEPNKLREMIRTCLDQCHDPDVEREVKRLETVLRRRIKRESARAVEKIKRDWTCTKLIQSLELVLDNDRFQQFLGEIPADRRDRVVELLDRLLNEE